MPGFLLRKPHEGKLHARDTRSESRVESTSAAEGARGVVANTRFGKAP
jgi:hypothetical protein